MKLTFQNSNLEERKIAEVKDEEEAMEKIKEFCDKQGYVIPYTRGWMHDGVIIYDVGSWSEFFNLYTDETKQLDETEQE